MLTFNLVSHLLICQELNMINSLCGCCGFSDSRDVMNGHRARVFAVQYHPHYPNTFISGGWDDTVQVKIF